MSKRQSPLQRPILRVRPELGEYSPNLPSPLLPEMARALYSPPRTLGADHEQAAALESAQELAQEFAQDSSLSGQSWPSLLDHVLGLGDWAGVAPSFPGYAVLAGLAQNGLIRAGVTTVADEMTRRWITIKHDGDANGLEDGDGKSAIISAACEEFGLQDLFNEAAQKCDFDGGCLIFVDTGARGEDLARPLHLDPACLGKGGIRRLTLVEALNVYPGPYNTTDPLAADYFRPETWLVAARPVHSSRFLYFAPNQMPVLLRPAYNFFGIPAAQLALDYVAHFTQTREAAQRLLTKFSLTVFKSDMSQILSGGGAEDFDRRMAYLAKKRDNDSILAVDMEREDVLKLETPLNGVTDIVRQSLEFVAALFRLPVVKLLGISPAGMNATGEFDERNFLDHVAGRQRKILGPPLEKAIKLLQLHCFGEIDPTLRAFFRPLTDEDEQRRAQTRKTEAEADSLYLKAGALSPLEVRRRLREEANAGFGFIQPSELPDNSHIE